MPVVAVKLFGAPRIEIDGIASGFNRTRALGLLAYLATSDLPSSREVLLSLLWPDFAPADAKNGLRRELSLLRRLLGSDTILANRSTISLIDGAHGLWVDVHEFQRLINRVRDHAEASSDLCDGCVADLEAAAVLYTADFLDGFALPDSPAFDTWQLSQAEQLNRSVAFVLETLVAWYTSQADLERALVLARRMLALDPTNESAGRNVMRLLAWSAQTSTALREFELLKQRLHAELDVQPDPATEEVVEQIRLRQLPPPPTTEPDPNPVTSPQTRQSRSHNLPADTTPFFGREEELANLDQLIANPDIRLITILGPGGIGKTRLALAAAARWAASNNTSDAQFKDGIYYVSLAPVGRADEIVTAIGRVLQYSFEGIEDRERQLSDFLRAKRLLLVLDNYEHLLDSNSAGLPTRILKRAPKVKFLVTSRSRLGSRSETVFALHGFEILELPLLSHASGGEDSLDLETRKQNPAIALFANAARRGLPDFEVTSNNLADVSRITRLVEGMPLGIELAAGWLELFTPGEVAREIETNLDFLASDWVDAPERQSSLRTVFDTSWRLLPDHEQRAVANLSIFRGGFSRLAAEAVGGASTSMLLALANKSWLQRGESQRFQIHELLRQFAEDQLRAKPDNYTAARERHSDFYAEYVAALHKQVKGSEPEPALAAFSVDRENIVAGWHWLVEHDQLADAVERMLPGILLYAEACFEKSLIDSVTEAGLRKLEHVRDESQDSNTVRFALQTAQNIFWENGWPARFMGYEYVSPDYRTGLVKTWELLNIDSAAPLWANMAASLVGMNVDYEVGFNFLRAVVDSPPSQYDEWDRSLARQLLGSLLAARAPNRLSDSQDDIRSQTFLAEALTGFQKIGAVREQAFTHMAMGFQHQNRGRKVMAAASLSQARDLFLRLGEPLPVASIDSLLGHLLLAIADFNAGFNALSRAAEHFLEQGHLALARGAFSSISYEALRYSTVEHALDTRNRALAISEQLELTWENAWDMWEMGEILRYMGRFTEARSWYDRGYAGFQMVHGANALTFYYRGLGDLAMGTDDFAEAYHHFETSLQHAEMSLHSWSMMYAARGLGDAALGLGQPAQARDHLVDALRYAYERQVLPGDPGGAYLSVFAAAARLLHTVGRSEDAKDLAQYVLANPLTWNETRRGLEKLPWTTPAEPRVLGDEDTFVEFMTMSRELSVKLIDLELTP